MAKLRPADYQPPTRRGGSLDAGELADAVKLARENPGVWVDVHEPREMEKPPTSWCSEVNGDKKRQLREALKPGERWEANYDVTLGSGRERLFTKMIRLVPPRDPSAPVPPPPEPPQVVAPEPVNYQAMPQAVPQAVPQVPNAQPVTVMPQPAMPQPVMPQAMQQPMATDW